MRKVATTGAGEQGDGARRLEEPTQFGSEVVEVIRDADSGDNLMAGARGRIVGVEDSPMFLTDWQRRLAADWKKERKTFTDLGAHLLDGLRFLLVTLSVASVITCSRPRPPRPVMTERGDLLPIHPSCVEAGGNMECRSRIRLGQVDIHLHQLQLLHWLN